MRFMRVLLAAVAIPLIVTSAAATDVFFQEVISDAFTLRVTRSLDGDSGVLFEETLGGNDEFGVKTNSLTFYHSVMGIEPPILPDGAIRVARLKLYLRGSSGEEIVAWVDSMPLDHVVRRNFLVDPQGDDTVSIQESPLQDGFIEIILSNPDHDFALYRSVFDVTYLPHVPTDVAEPENARPDDFELGTNYPNPFNPATEIEYRIGVNSQVQVIVYDVSGQQVKVLVNERQPAGRHTVTWDGTDAVGRRVASGVYFYRIQTEYFTSAKKMILLK
ncbi:MAG TPA: FlgD immunoglobulin-like domain containing protein [Candidatus Deferrimicrobium sp.]|nr:FlgD immunoglobulin-like domain containing protein [Candidatus Deferrimicrobium sp.]